MKINLVIINKLRALNYNRMSFDITMYNTMKTNKCREKDIYIIIYNALYKQLLNNIRNNLSLNIHISINN